MTQIEQMSDLLIKKICDAYMAGEITISKPLQPIKGNKEGSIMEQVFYEFETRNLQHGKN